MRSEAEVLSLIEIYEEDLAEAVSNYYAASAEEDELIIFALMEKLEVLFWLLGKNITPDTAYNPPGLYH